MHATGAALTLSDEHDWGLRGESTMRRDAYAGTSVPLVDDLEAKLLGWEAVLEPLGCRLVRATSGQDDLRNPMASIAANASIIQGAVRKGETAGLASRVEGILRGVARMDSLASDLLATGR